MRTINRVTLTLFVLFLATTMAAQSRYLSRKISLDLPSCSVDVALLEIGKAADFRFSYDADLFPADRQVRVRAKDTPVNTLLRDMLGKDVKPREVGNHVILVRNQVRPDEVKKAYPNVTIRGVIRDASDRSPLADATVYEVEKRLPVISGKEGNYTLVVPSGKKSISLSFSKNGYHDTVVFLKQAADIRVDMLLRPVGGGLSPLERRSVTTIRISGTDSMAIVNWLVPTEALTISKNLEVRTSRTFQASVIPFIGTNWRVSGAITNRLSLNMLAGYSGGLDGLEVGGLLNITRRNIRGIQIGGLGNIVGGTGYGLQLGGLFNFDLGKFEGLQIGGLLNYAPDTIRGLQIGGLVNVVTGQIKGVQIGGLTNVVSTHCDGWQVGGLVNVTRLDARKVQLAGLVNYSGNTDGVQVAGLMNISRKHNSGVQIAGLLNYATYVHGLQLGAINVANTVERGVPVGLFSYVFNGYHPFEVSGNEIFYGNVAFKTGTRTFYNIIQFGMGGDLKMHLSYGLGTIFRLSDRFSLSLDATAGLVYHPVDTIYHGLLMKFIPTIEYRLAKHFAVFLGPSYNYYLFTKGEPNATPRGLSPYDFYFRSTENSSIQMWLGGTVGIRL